jgi:hypothetical protein
LRIRTLAAAAALFVTIAGHVLAAEPREVAGHVADQIAANYFDTAKGAAIAAELKAEAAKGAYDRYVQPLDLAQALTVRLKPLDAHFNVAWSPAPRPAMGGPARGRPAERAAPDRRANYGFHKVQVLPGNIGLIDMRYFADFEPKEVGGARAAADAALALVAGTDAVIFDLRDNGGGSPAMVGYLVGHFVPAGADVYNTFKGRGAERNERPTVEIAPAARRVSVPLYVLTSARTGSAAESFPYTLQAARRATIVGEASGGAANPGGPAQAGDGFSVFISRGRPVNPITKANWEGTGVIPDVTVPAADALTRAQALALGGLIKAGLPEPAATEDRWALEALAEAPAVLAGTLAEYAGAYGPRTVAVEAGKVIVRQGRRPPMVLRPVSEDAFTVEGAAFPLRLKFERDAQGRVAGLLQMAGDGQTARYARD